jgi:DNA topoisomerase-1
MRYLNRVKIDEKVYKNINKFIKGKEQSDDLFDLIDAQKLNDYLKSLMDGLSAKVFRTYNASFVLQQELDKQIFKINDPIEDKVSYYNEANKQVAILCNHQRTVPKNYNVKSEQMKNELDAYNEYLNQLEDYVKNFKKSKNKYEETTIGKLKKVFPNDKNKAEKVLHNLKDKVKKMDIKLKEREGNKQVALGTSKLNYMDPRITVGWCKKYEVPIEKVFSKSIRDKFPWAMYTSPDYKF